MRTWDILVPTFYARTPMFLELLDQFEAQMRPGVRLIVERGERDPGHIAEKMQRLFEASDADYTCICGDDALLHPEYVSLLHTAMQQDPGPDVIGFKLQVDELGVSAASQHRLPRHPSARMVSGPTGSVLGSAWRGALVRPWHLDACQAQHRPAGPLRGQARRLRRHLDSGCDGDGARSHRGLLQRGAGASAGG